MPAMAFQGTSGFASRNASGQALGGFAEDEPLVKDRYSGGAA